ANVYYLIIKRVRIVTSERFNRKNNCSWYTPDMANYI
ncbi:unnamed protein product, partial [marine sediment metagenome]